MRTLPEWLEYIEHAHTQEIDMGLSRTRQVFSRLCALTNSNLSNACVVTVAGTNGKGTTCRFIEQACLTAGKTVSVYASPHIEVFNERIRVNGANVPDSEICDAFALVYQATKSPELDVSADVDTNQYQDADISLSYFEYATLCAFVIFAKANVDVCVLEVGLGGRLDATNIIDANIGVITSIGLDHQAYLGDTKELIAKEKAGIVKQGQTLVVGYKDRQRSVDNIIAQYKLNTLLAGRDFDIEPSRDLEGNQQQRGDSQGWVKLQNTHHRVNLKNALIPPQNVMTGIAVLLSISRYFDNNNSKVLDPFLVSFSQLQQLINQVSMPGRFEIIETSVLQTTQTLILDVAHNEDSAKYLVHKLNTFITDKQLLAPDLACHIIIGMLKDKNVEATIDCLADKIQIDKCDWYAVDLPSQRGEKARRLSDAIKKNGGSVSCYTYDHEAIDDTNNETVNCAVKAAFSAAIDSAHANDIILVVGSFILASELMREIKQP